MSKNMIGGTPMYKSSFIHYLTKALADIIFYGGILFCITVPFLMLKLTNFFGYKKSVILPFTAILLSSGLCALYILWQLKAMFKALLGGKLMSEVPYKEGITEMYYESAKLYSEAPLKDGKGGGIAQMYYENGKLMAETLYKADKKEAIKKEYYDDGKLKSETPYKSYKREGIEKRYYKNGQLKSETPYKDNLIDGIVKEYDETGNVKAKEASV